MIVVKDLVKDFGQLRAVDNLSLEVPRGQILGFLGPNGAGKSTTMKMLTGFIAPTSGHASIGGCDTVTNSLEVRRKIGYLPESAPSYGEMTVSEFLEFIAAVRELPVEASCDRVASLCGLGNVWYQPIETLSKGYRQRVAFAQAMLHDPEVLILDEPTDGLDPNQKHEVRKIIRAMGADKTIVLSTHILEEVDALCSRVVIIAEGKLLLDEPIESLRARGPLEDTFRTVTITSSSRGGLN